MKPKGNIFEISNKLSGNNENDLERNPKGFYKCTHSESQDHQSNSLRDDENQLKGIHNFDLLTNGY